MFLGNTTTTELLFSYLYVLMRNSVMIQMSLPENFLCMQQRKNLESGISRIWYLEIISRIAMKLTVSFVFIEINNNAFVRF